MVICGECGIYIDCAIGINGIVYTIWDCYIIYSCLYFCDHLYITMIFGQLVTEIFHFKSSWFPITFIITDIAVTIVGKTFMSVDDI